jgi:hypothetical protein
VGKVAEDPFVMRFGTRAGWAAQLFYKAIREHGVENVLANVLFRANSQRYTDPKMAEVRDLICTHPYEAEEFARIAVRRSQMSPNERAEEKKRLATEAIHRAARDRRAVSYPGGVGAQTPAAPPVAAAPPPTPVEEDRRHQSTVELVFGRGRAPVHVATEANAGLVRRFRR